VSSSGEQIRVRGLVQGVGFRPTVWRLACELGLGGDVRNDGTGVLIRLWGEAATRDDFCERLRSESPPLARIQSIERTALTASPEAAGFRILASAAGAVQTGIVPDAATCAACTAEIADPDNRRFRYPFTNCTHCGPRLSIVRGIPYDRATTSMAVFPMCRDCAREYEDPADRRFHAQPNACPVCGPRAWVEDRQGHRLDPAAARARDAVELASRLLRDGRILAIKGIGGFHLACDACDEASVAELRARKRRYRKPFALMARDLDVIRAYCRVDDREAALLQDAAAPVVLLQIGGDRRVARSVAPGQRTLGFMLPYSPLHRLLLDGWDRPLVMTSGNLSEEPQCIANAEAEDRLRLLADVFLLHDREIVNRVDDSVMRVIDGAPRLLRRARGYAPQPIALPRGLEDAPPVLALGGELKSTICLVQHGQAILSQHLGDLEDARTFAEYERTVELYSRLFGHSPECLVVDLHPGYRPTRFGRAWASRAGLSLAAVQHHHAHIAAVLADNGWPADAGPVLGIALDGLGYGDDGTLWGGELLLADYAGFERLAHLAAAAMPGGTRAILEPWRNTVAQLQAHLGLDAFARDWADLELYRYLAGKPTGIVASMMASGVNSPLSSSCGRLFDAVAAAIGLCRDRASYEGEAAIELEALVDDRAASRPAGPTSGDGYPFAVRPGLPQVLDPAPLWPALLADLRAGAGAGAGEIAARFHRGLADAMAALAGDLAAARGVGTVAMSGGVLQNRTLAERMASQLRQRGLEVLQHCQVPANDGGLALGQACVGAMRILMARPSGP
jgi:hydrogenase maturation protein HypF